MREVLKGDQLDWDGSNCKTDRLLMNALVEDAADVKVKFRDTNGAGKYGLRRVCEGLGSGRRQ